MVKYNWTEIAGRYSDSELKRIFKDRDVEPDEKVDAVIKELKRRNLISDDEIVKIQDDEAKVNSASSYVLSVRPNAERAKIAAILILVMLGIDIMKIVFDLLQLDLILDIKNNIPVSQQRVMYNTIREFLWAFLFIATYIFSIITFIQWFRRAYFNLHLRISKCKYSEGWAAGSWFVPIISLFQPYEIMRELWKNTTTLIKGYSSEDSERSGAIVGWWWVLFISDNLLSNITSRLEPFYNSVDNLIFATIASLAICVIHIILAIVTYTMIKRYSAMEHELFELEKRSLITDNI